jgi:hypothetical protein
MTTNHNATVERHSTSFLDEEVNLTSVVSIVSALVVEVVSVWWTYASWNPSKWHCRRGNKAPDRRDL